LVIVGVESLVRRALAATTGTLLIGTLFLAGPALSGEHYVPEPVEFELSAPPGGLGEPGGREAFVSDPLHAPERFNLVGFTWDGEAEPAISVRVSEDGELWEDWTTVPTHADGAPDPARPEPGPSGAEDGASAPVWAGQAEYVQYRLSRRPPDLRLEFVNSTGTATAADRVETAARSLVNDGVLVVAGLAAAEAGDSAPDMVSRERWGAEDCAPRRQPDTGKVKAAFVHHTVTANSYTRSEARSMVLGICRYHRNTLGWDDIGYNFLVDRFGTLYEGRAGGIGRAVVGAQTQGFNNQSTGIANLGTYGSHRQSGRGIRAMARLIRWKLPLHGQPTKGRTTLISQGGEHNPYRRGQAVTLKRISGHRDGSMTECPGNRLYGQLRDLRGRLRG
jgi:uncharacterized protein with LGFP repeats